MDTRIAVIAARFNAKIVDALLADCVARLEEIGLPKNQIFVYRVPGAFELPVAAKVAAQTRRFSAIICLGAVIRGDTPHFDYVAGQCADGITRTALSEGLPVIFGVLTTNTEDQALARTDGAHSRGGIQSADAAAEMIHVLRSIQA
jgi:6,7-dimethyl-8-ribityllumazine synthase